MRIFLFAEYYQNYLNSFYKKTKLSHLNYQEHLEKLFKDYFGSFVSYYNHFKKIGHEVTLVVGNDSYLQNKWLKEHGVESAEIMNKKDIVLMQIQEFKPDVFFIGSMFEYYGDFLRRVSKITKNIFAWIACPYPKYIDFSYIKCVISSAEEYVKRFRDRRLNSEVLRAAFDTDIISFLDNEKTIDVSFIGSMSKRTHSRRVKGLEYVLKNGINLKTFGYGLKRSILPFMNSQLFKTYAGELWGIEMYRTLNNSKISLNFHIDVAKGFSGNMRLYEATGCGTLLMTENTPDLEDKFRVGKDIISYESFEDIVDKIKYYLSHEQELENIAKAGQKACIEKHGYDKRIIEFENILMKYCT